MVNVSSLCDIWASPVTSCTSRWCSGHGKHHVRERVCFTSRNHLSQLADSAWCSLCNAHNALGAIGIALEYSTNACAFPPPSPPCSHERTHTHTFIHSTSFDQPMLNSMWHDPCVRVHLFGAYGECFLHSHKCIVARWALTPVCRQRGACFRFCARPGSMRQADSIYSPLFPAAVPGQRFCTDWGDSHAHWITLKRVCGHSQSMLLFRLWHGFSCLGHTTIVRWRHSLDVPSRGTKAHCLYIHWPF